MAARPRINCRTQRGGAIHHDFSLRSTRVITGRGAAADQHPDQRQRHTAVDTDIEVVLICKARRKMPAA
jgi:hypothetical protein